MHGAITEIPYFIDIASGSISPNVTIIEIDTIKKATISPINSASSMEKTMQEATAVLVKRIVQRVQFPFLFKGKMILLIWQLFHLGQTRKVLMSIAHKTNIKEVEEQIKKEQDNENYDFPSQLNRTKFFLDIFFPKCIINI